MLAWYYFVLISSVLMGISTIIEKNTLKNEHAAAYSAAFTIIILPLSLIFLPFANFHITLYEVAIIYAVSLISTSTYVLSARAYRHGNISITSPLLSSLPVMFTVLFAFLFIEERLSFIQYASIAVLIISSYFMVFDTGKNVQNGYKRGKYVAILLLDSVLMAAGTVIMKYLFDLNVNIFTYLILVEYFIALNMVLVMLFRYGGLGEIAANIKRYKVPILAIAVLTTLYRVTYYLAAAPAAIGLVYTLRNSVYVLITVAIGGILFSEKKLAFKTILSAIIIVAAYALIS
jgi:drug/metabolite transporter (DMT)-like permease